MRLPSEGQRLTREQAKEEVARMVVWLTHQGGGTPNYRELLATPAEPIPPAMLAEDEGLRARGVFSCDNTVPGGLRSTYATAVSTGLVDYAKSSLGWPRPSRQALLVLTRGGFIFRTLPDYQI